MFLNEKEVRAIAARVAERLEERLYSILHGQSGKALVLGAWTSTRCPPPCVALCALLARFWLRPADGSPWLPLYQLINGAAQNKGHATNAADGECCGQAC